MSLVLVRVTFVRVQGREHVDVPLPEFMNPGGQIRGIVRLSHDSIEPFLRKQKG